MVDFADLKARVSIDKVVTMLGLTMKKSGAQIRSQCPACKGSDRSLAITIERGSYYCFDDKAGGDCIALVCHVLGLKPREAAEKIASHFGLDSPSTAPRSAPPQGGIPELDYLDPLHELVESMGLPPAAADAIGAGFAPKGYLAGYLAFPIRLPSGVLIGYCGVNPEKEPPVKFHDSLEDRALGKVVPLRRKG